MSERSGRVSREPFATYDPASSSWKTSLQSLPLENLPELPVTWPLAGTWDLGGAYELPTSELHTNAAESSSLLPTPRASDANEAGAHGSGTPDLRTTVSLLPTPRATDGTKGGPNQRGSSGDLMLPSAVMLLPTPTATDAKGSRNATAGRSNPNSKHHSGMTLLDVFWTGPDTNPLSDAGN